MAYRLKRKEPVAEGVARIAREQFDAAAGELGRSHRPAVVHGARKRLKMLRALLRLVRPALDRATFASENHALRDAGRTLSRLRDADVIVEVIRTLRPVRGGDAAFVQVLTRAQQERRKVRHEFRSAGTIAAARRDIVDAGARLEGWATREIDGDAIIAGLRRSLKRARASAPGRSLDDERWHEWRKRTKDMWYHLRLVKSVWPTILDGAIGQFKVLADDLGDDHDLAIISGRLHELSPNRGAVRELGRLRHAIARRRDELHAKAIANGRCLLAATPRAFAERFEASWRSWRS